MSVHRFILRSILPMYYPSLLRDIPGNYINNIIRGIRGRRHRGFLGNMDRRVTDMYKSAFDGRMYLDTSYNIFHGHSSAYPFFRKDKVQLELDIFKYGNIKGHRLLEFGCGPSIDFTIVPCPYFNKVYMADFSNCSRNEIELWRLGSPRAFDWSGYFKHIMHLEGNGYSWEKRQAELKSKVKAVFPCDILQNNPLSPNELEPFDCVITASCLNSACAIEEDFIAAMENVAGLVKSGGDFLSFTALGNTRYSVAGKVFPLLNIDENLHKYAIEKAGLFIKTTITKDLDSQVESQL